MSSSCAVLCVTLAALGCSGGNDGTASAAPGQTFIGTPLREPAWSPDVKTRLEKDLEIAQATFDVAPEREDSWIWLGRRLGYLARYPEAIDVFTRGLETFPDSYRLLRFRGRHLARDRQFERALTDYRRAAELVEDVQDSFEPDGIINPRNQFLGTYRSNIHYYLGQTSFAVGDYETMLSEMERALAEQLGYSDDRLISTVFWRYVAHRKLGQHAEARQIVNSVPEDLEMVENFTYYESVLFFKGARTRDEVLSGADNLIRFAVAIEHHFQGEQDLAEDMWRDVVENSAQGFWPAEVELVAGGNGG